MTERDDTQLLSAWLDHELNPTEEEIVRRRLDDEPDFKAEFERLRRASDAIRMHFSSAEAGMSDLEANREDFIRTTLSLGDRIARKPWWSRSWVRASAGLLVVATVVIAVRLAGRSEERAAWLVAAAESALAPSSCMSIVIERPELLGRRPPVNVLCGPNGQWVVEAERSLRVPGVFTARRAGPVRITSGGRIYLGSDGDRVWLWLEGEDVVKVLAIDEPMPALSYFRAFLSEASDGAQRSPLLDWGRVQDVLEGAAQGRLQFGFAGEETINAERLLRYDVILDAKTTSRVWISSADRAVRRVTLGLLTLSFEGPLAVPKASFFHWSSRAPSGVAVEQLR